MAYYDVVGEGFVEEIIANEERAEFRLQHRILRDMNDPFQLPGTQFKNIFRFNKNVARIIIDMISPHMYQGERSTSLPVHLKILSTLHFYASGSYQLTTGKGYYFAFSQPSISRSIDEVTNAICNHLLPNWIQFSNSINKRNMVKNGFMEKYNFPRCLGAIDCTHIAIVSPPEEYPALPYYCRKGYYSINGQIIVDSDYNILNLNARFPGSTHDSAIWQASNVKVIMENLYVQGDDAFLIGDSGYPLKPFLLTPFENPPENTPESTYNYHFVRARNIVEKVNRVLKSRFRCLLKHRVLNYDPVKSGKIIYSCGVLHNIARFYRDDLPEDEIIDLDEDGDDDQPNDDFLRNVLGIQNWHARGEQVRNEIVQQYFNN